MTKLKLGTSFLLIYIYLLFFARFFFIAFLNPLPNCLQQFVSLMKTFTFFLLSCDICDISEVNFVLFLFVDWELKWLYKRLVLFYDSDWKCLISGGGLPNSISLCWNNWLGRLAMKAKIIHLIFTVLVGIATIVSAICAVLSYLKM